MKSTLVVLYAETPLHAGSGVGLGAVDLPIQRERMSGLPMVQGSGIKGALRERMRPYREDRPQSFQAGQEGRLDPGTFLSLFGPWAPAGKGSDDQDEPKPGEAEDQPKPDEFAGALSIRDAHILLFPVRTAFGGFAWLTCPLILDRLRRDAGLVDLKLTFDLGALQPDGGEALVTTDSAVSREDRLIIEDLDYSAKPEGAVNELARWLAENAFPEGDDYEPFRQRIEKQLAVVDDTEFAFLSRHATEVVARTRIDHDTGTVSRGALWTEESLPAESVLWSVAMFADSRNPNRTGKRDELREAFVDKAGELSRIYLGGDRSVGRGMVGLRVASGEKGGGER